MKKVVASMMIMVLFSTGCTGSFNLTRKLYNWHRSQSDKWADELCFLLVALTPVYGLATFADAIVFNSIEFWTGKNPVEMSALPSQSRLAMSYNTKTAQVNVALANNHGFIFEHTPTGVLAKNDKGQVIYSSVQNENGSIALYNGKGQLIKEYSAEQIALLKEKVISE